MEQAPVAETYEELVGYRKQGKLARAPDRLQAYFDAILSEGARSDFFPGGFSERGQLLVAAAREDDLVLVARMLREEDPPVDANYQDIFGQTALHMAALHGNVGVVEALLARGADPALANGFNYTALDYCLWSTQYIYVNMSVCIYVYMYICIYVSMYIYTPRCI